MGSTRPQPQPFVFVHTPCHGESAAAASARARANTFVFVTGESSTSASTVAKKRERPRGSAKATTATIGKGKQKAAHDDGVFCNHIADDDIAQTYNTSNPTNGIAINNPIDNNSINESPDNITISDPANSNANAINGLTDNNAVTVSQTDLYSVLGPGRVDWFYTDGCLFGYDSDYLGEPSSGNVQGWLGEKEKEALIADEQNEQDEQLLADEGDFNEPIPEGGDSEEEEVVEEEVVEEEYHGGLKPFNESNYPLHFFYERYFAQFPMDNATEDTDSDYSNSSDDEEDEEDEENTTEMTHTHTSIMTSKRKSRKETQPQTKRSRLDQRTKARPTQVEDVEDVEDMEGADDVEELQRFQDQDQLTAETTLMQRPGETYEKFLQRKRLDQEFEAMKANFLKKAKESNPNKVKLTKEELDIIHLKHKEKITLYESSDLRIQQHARGTRAAYGQFQRHWRRWCKRKGYRMEGSRKVDFRVEYGKFFLWLREGTAVEGYDGGGDRKMAVLPFFVTKSVQVSEISVSGRGRAVSRRVRDLPSVSTLLQHINGINDLRVSQGNSGILRDRRGPVHVIRGAAVDAITKAYKTRIAGDPRTESKKYATINHAGGKELDKLRDVMKAAWTDRYRKDEIKNGKNLPHKLTSLRTRLIVSWKHFMMMQGGNIRMAKLPHINFHHFANLTGAITEPRPSTFAIVLIMPQEETLRHGGCTYGVAVRNSEVEICPVGSLAFYLFYLWQTHEGGKPDLHDNKWHDIHLVHGNGKKKEHPQFSSNMNLDGMARLFRATGIATNKPTHFYRHSGTNHAHDVGTSPSAIQIHGGWQPSGDSRLNTHYLHPLPKGVAYAMAGASQPGLPPWIRRDCVTPPVALQRQIFPFIEEDYYTECPDWLLWTRNIMEGRSELDGRSNPMPMPGESNRAGVLRLKFLLLLVHLRKVLLQDAVALMELVPKDGILYSHHHVFNLPVFKSPEFHAFKDELVAKMITLAPPQSDSLRHNAPYLEAEFRPLNSTTADAIRSIKGQLDQDVNRVITEFKELVRSNANDILNTTKTVSSAQMATLQTSIETIQDQHAQAMIYALQALPSLYYQRLRSLKQSNASTTATTAISVPPQPQIIPPLQQNEQSNQATLPQEDYIDEMEDNDMGTAGQELPLTRQLDATNMSVDLVQVTPDAAPQIPLMQVQLILPSGPPLSLNERLDMLAVEVAESRRIIEFDVSDGFTYEMVSRSRPLKEHWEEWFYGLTRDGVQQPSIYWLNGNHRHHTFANSHTADTAWRYVDPGKDRNIYNHLWTFKKAIVRGILKVMLDLEGDIMYRERTALAEVAALIQHNTVTLNQFQKRNRKD